MSGPAAASSDPVAILVVEDDDLIRRLLARALERQGYSVTTAASAREAQSAWNRQPNHFRVLISDIVMPGQNGLELAKALHASRRDLRVLLITGFAPAEVLGENEGTQYPLMRKPFTGNQLVERVEQLLASP